ncbi:MAG: hypothetical protein JWO31_973 [Phycisphaerales bacterium]|nr:hypothetical protein [Phycisphaerales bacterium]
MTVGGLEIPKLLSTLIATGVWPSGRDALAGQNNRSLIPPDRNRRLRRICSHPPPFATLAQTGAGTNPDDFYARHGAVHELVTGAAVEIADRGLGADSPILPDFRRGPADPSVIGLEWPGGGRGNTWVEMAPDFESFADMLGPRPPAAA